MIINNLKLKIEKLISSPGLKRLMDRIAAYEEETKMLAFEASSPKELNKYLIASSDSQAPWQPVALSISGPKVLVSPFHLIDVPSQDVKHHLLNEAVELMSLTSDDIELDFQVTDTDEHNIKGVYVCAPRKVVEDYLMVLDERQLDPAVITEQFLTCVNALYRQKKIGKGRIAFLHFSPGNIISLFVSNDEECELLRKIPFEDFEEAQTEIVQSLRSASAKSRLKHYDVIYYTGSFEGIGALGDALRAAFKTELEECSTAENSSQFSFGNSYFDLNLLKKHIFSRQQNWCIRMGINIVLGLCLLNFFVLGARTIFKARAIDKVKSSYQVSGAKQAPDLKEEKK